MDNTLYISKKDIRTLMTVVCEIKDYINTPEVQEILNSTNLDYKVMSNIVAKGLDFEIDAQ